MLASISQMETVRSFPQNTNSPMRHPSAEDLDAAQQLISSAQAGREHLARHYGDGHGIKQSGSPPPDSGSASGQLTDERADRGQDRASPRAQKDTSFLGHSCRYASSKTKWFEWEADIEVL